MDILTLLEQLELISQVPVPGADAISGASGWVGTGLLGSVLGWLLFIHLPGKDKQIAGMVDSRDKLAEKLTLEFRQALTELVTKSDIKGTEINKDFKESLQKIIDHCEKQVGGTVELIRKEIDRIGVIITEIGKNKLSTEQSAKDAWGAVENVKKEVDRIGIFVGELSDIINYQVPPKKG